ncbi:MAG: pyridoxal phosphate-dependent aminotransferase [Candidatus Omnitrophica bacterium]|nr:pyridoxal phosphate-dependent aminotransferase [Candidatus Omnitrophota bacterium]
MTERFFKFSARTNWDLSENPLSLELETLKAKGVEIFDLTESNPTRAGFQYSPDIFLKPLTHPESLIYAPHPQGLLSAREAVARYYKEKGEVISPEQLVLTSSTSEAYSFLFRLLFNAGDRVLVPAPSYPLFSYLAGLNDVEVDYYQLEFSDGVWQINFPSIESSMTALTRAVILVSPNNPTGSSLKKEELKKLNKVCRAHNLAIISDEVFSDYLFDERDDICKTVAGNNAVPIFALGGVSKALAMPQMKLSWIVSNGPGDYLSQCMPRLEMIADTYLSVNTPVQNAASAWLKERHVIRDQVLNRVKENFSVLKKGVSKNPRVSLFPVEGGWYAVLKADLLLPEDEWAIKLLRDKQVYVHPGFYFDFKDEGYIVLSLLPRPEIFQEGIFRLMSAF